MRHSFLSAVQKLHDLVCSYEYKLFSRESSTQFTRKRKLDFKTTLFTMLNFCKKSLQIEIDKMFDKLEKGEYASKQAFSKARQQILPEAVKLLFETTVETVAQNPEMASVGGFTPIAIDGTTIAMDNLPELANYFGYCRKGTTACTARASVASDATFGIVLDAVMCPYSVGERELATMHIKNIFKLGVPNPLFLMDRGYDSLEIISDIEKAGGHYIVRIRERWMKDLVSSTKSGEWGEFVHNKTTYRVRVIKLTTPAGESEVLFTNVDELNEEAFKQLYSLRWTVESKYRVVKNLLQLENFSGKTVQTMYQDFWATMMLSNLAAMAKIETDARIKEARKDKGLKHTYQTNNNLLIGKMKDLLYCLLAMDDPLLRGIMFNNFAKRLSRLCVPVTRGETKPRKPPRQGKNFNYCTKSAL